MRKTLLGLYTYLEFSACLLGFLPVLGAVRALEPDNLRVRGRWMRRFGRLTARLNPLWRFSVEGTPPADVGHAAYVVVANHESSADPFLLSGLPWDMRWVSKEELFHVPVLGQLLRLGGDIPLRRGDRVSVARMLAEARATLADGLPVMIFPEGTRSPDGQLGQFKDGAFQLAIEAGVPILPLAIEGTRACRPKGSLWFGEASARVRVLPAISTHGLTLTDLPGLRERTRARIAGALDEMRYRSKYGAGGGVGYPRSWPSTSAQPASPSAASQSA
jgi:1-acyl-sn-glycerol-3-phosphate acyltransferase